MHRPSTTELDRDVRNKSRPRSTEMQLQLQRTEYRNRVLTMVRNGASAEQVVELLAAGQPPLEVTEQAIKQFVKKYLNKIHTEDALTIEEMRVLENERLDRLWTQLANVARNEDGSPNLKVIDRMTRLSERRSKMNGFEAAQRHEHVVYDGLAALGLDKELAERGQQAWISGSTEDPAVEIADADVVEESEDDGQEPQPQPEVDEGPQAQDDGGSQAGVGQELPGLERQAGASQGRP